MKVNRTELFEMLKKIRPGLAKRQFGEKRANFNFTGTDILTYNGRISISHPFISDFKCVVMAKELFDILENIKEENISLHLNDDQTELRVVSALTEAGLRLEAKQLLEDLFQALEDTSKSEWKKIPGIGKGLAKSVMVSISGKST